MTRRMRWTALAATAAVVASAALLAAGAGPATANRADPDHARVDHVLLLSVDGLHQFDLTWWVSHHPDSTLAALVGHGVEYSNAQTTFPSDSFPGMVAQVTGGSPK